MAGSTGASREGSLGGTRSVGGWGESGDWLSVEGSRTGASGEEGGLGWLGFSTAGEGFSPGGAGSTEGFSPGGAWDGGLTGLSGVEEGTSPGGVG